MLRILKQPVTAVGCAVLERVIRDGFLLKKQSSILFHLRSFSPSIHNFWIWLGWFFFFLAGSLERCLLWSNY